MLAKRFLYADAAAADKLRIYSTVKLSSATDAYPALDLDYRPKFNVAIIYEDTAAASGQSISTIG
jgi:hypothetical protein